MLRAIALRCHGGLPPKECVRQAVAAERAGFSTVWFAENPFSRGAWPAAAACAVATRHIRIGLGVVNPHNRHPTLMAMEVAAFDELSEGRAVLGIGAGIPSRVRRLQAPIDRPIAAVREVVQYVPCAVRDDGAEARRLAKRSVAAMLRAYMETASAATRAAIAEYGRSEDFARAMVRLGRGDPPEDAIDDRLLADYAIAGAPDECLAQCRTYVEAGVTELAIGPVGERGAEDIARLGGAMA